MKKEIVLIGLSLMAGVISVDARMAPPENLPAELKEAEPHRPQVAEYYLAELVAEGKMTQSEANRTEVYMIFRDRRRQKDLKAVEGMDKTARRAFMAQKRKERGNPLEEYANICGFPLERARVLMDYMHGSDKGTKYYKKAEK